MKRQFLLYTLLLWVSASFTQDVSWYAKADQEVGINTAFRVEFVLENENGSSFEAPKFGGLRVLSGPMYSSSTQIMNGRSSSTISYVFEVVASKVGEYTIGSASITVNRQKVKTKPLKISVTKGRNIAGLLKNEGSEMILKMELSDSVAYVGQQVILNYVLYYTGGVRFNGLLKEDEFQGIYAQRIQGSSRTKTMIQNGKEYKSSIISSLALFPQKSGNFEISPCVAKVGIPINTGRSRSFFSFQRYNNMVLEAEPINLNVVELPKGAPSGFSGAVGEFELQTGVNTTKTSTDDAIVMHLAIRGDGDIRLLEAPKIKFSDAWEVYEPTIVEEKEFIQSDRIFNFKKFEYLLLPKVAGQLKIQPSFTYYSLDSMNYQTITARPTYIDVTKGNRKVLFEDSKILSDKDLAPLRKTLSDRDKSNNNPFISTLFLGSFGLFLFVGLGMFWKKRNLDDYLALSPEERKRLEAVKLAQARFKKALVLKERNESKSFYDEISIAMNGYLADKYNIPHSAISKSYLKALLDDKYPNTHIPTQYIELLNQCELALFAGQSGESKMEEIYDLSVTLISDIEGLQD